MICKLLIMIISLVLISSDAHLSLAGIECGIQKTHLERVVSGDNASLAEFPWIVSLHKRGVHFCGGVLIGKQWVLTAAHCLHNRKTSELRVAVGGHERKLFENAPHYYNVPVDEIIFHPNYIYPKILDDIALVRIHEIGWNDFVQPACLPNQNNETFSGYEATVAGWGLTSEGGRLASILQKVSVPIMENTKCQEWFSDKKKSVVLSDRSMCAGFEAGGKDACQNDSGGPLMVKEEGRLVIVGIVSSGIGCARPKLPGLYTRVNKYIDWMIKITKSKIIMQEIIRIRFESKM